MIASADLRYGTLFRMNMLMLGGWAAAATRATVATRRNADELISIKAGAG